MREGREREGELGLISRVVFVFFPSFYRGSKLQDKEILAESLVDLGDLTRDMKDKLM